MQFLFEVLKYVLDDAKMRTGAHTQYDLQYHIVWITKYRRKIINAKIASRLKVLLMQGCSARNIVIIKGNIISDYIHLLISAPPSLSVAQIMQYLKGRSSKKLQEEFPELRKQFGDNICGRLDIFAGQLEQLQMILLRIIL